MRATNEGGKCSKRLEHLFYEMEKKRLVWIDLLRILALWGVICIHVLAGEFSLIPTDNFYYKVEWSWISLGSYAVPIFLMLSGMMMLKREHSIKDILISKIGRIIGMRLSAALISGIVALIYFLVIGYAFSAQELWDSAWGWREGMLFLIILGGCYLITPLLQKFCQDDKLEGYFLLLSFICTFLVPYLSQVTGRDLITWMEDSAQFRFTTGILFYYVLGHYLPKHLGAVKSWMASLFLLTGLAGTILLACYSVHHTTPGIITSLTSSRYSGYTSLAVLYLATSIFVFFYVVVGKWQPGEKTSHIINHMGRNNMIVYLSHGPLISTVGRYIRTPICPILSVGIVLKVTIIFALGYVISLIWERVPGLRKLI